jgi:predicted RNase H-like HicB family nuclease
MYAELLLMSEREHKPIGDCEYQRGLYIYLDEETDLWVAYKKFAPVSSCGDTKEDAIENCKTALEDYYEDETTYWDTWSQQCPDCSDGQLEPLQYSCRDEQDNRVYCRMCETTFELKPKSVN